MQTARTKEPSVRGGGGPATGARAAMGTGLGVLIALAASVALVLGQLLFTVPAFAQEGPLWAVFFGLVLACAAATPVALRLGRGRGALAAESPKAEPGGANLAPAPSGRAGKAAEQELLEAVERHHGGITPVRAALETSLTVAEADRMLSDLAKDGHLGVRAEGGKLLYGL